MGLGSGLSSNSNTTVPIVQFGSNDNLPVWSKQNAPSQNRPFVPPIKRLHTAGDLNGRPKYV